MIDSTTFAEMRWQRDLFSPGSFVLPTGFEKRAHLFTRDFVDVLKDLHALQTTRDSQLWVTEDTVTMMHIDNQQAWIQSKLTDLSRQRNIQEYCRLAAYICACMLCCKVYRFSTIPVSDP
jgi:aminoglycoside phosphotransferase (APT) family kinase protein